MPGCSIARLQNQAPDKGCSTLADRFHNHTQGVSR
jgi:hypothetical protein